MGVDRADPDTSTAHRTWLALASIAVWVVAAAAAGGVGIWAAIGGAAIALGASVWFVDRAETKRILQPSRRLVLLGAVAGGVMTAATYVLYPALAQRVPFFATDTAILYAVFRAPSVAVTSVALVPIILGEELVWRGVVQATLVRRLGTWGGVAAAAIAYALAHAPLRSPVLVLAALSCGIAWGALRAASGSLVPPLVAHIVWDVVVLLSAPLDRHL